MNSSTTSGRSTVVAYIRYTRPQSFADERCGIFLEDSLTVGRDHKCNLVFDDLRISQRHLRIYCVVYDHDEEIIQPLIYAEDLSRNGSYWNGQCFGEGNRVVLLSHGDELRISPSVSLHFETLAATKVVPINHQQRVESEYFRGLYQITSRLLGSGAQGHVYMALNVVDGHQLACKIVDLRKIRQEEARSLNIHKDRRDKNTGDTYMENASSKHLKTKHWERTGAAVFKVRRECEILKGISHPNVVQLESTYETDHTLFIFEEILAGGDLLSYIEKRGGRLQEAEAGIMVRQILEGVEHLHKKGVTHRDLKPENIMISSLGPGARIVLTDFGNSVKSISEEGKPVSRLNTSAGTIEYTAPEVYGRNPAVGRRGYTNAVDMWAVGCITVVLLTGSLPFQSDILKTFSVAISQDVLNGLLNDHPYWQTISLRPKDFIEQLLVLDERSRLSAEKAMDHHWLTNEHVKEAFDTAYGRAVASWKSMFSKGPPSYAYT